MMKQLLLAAALIASPVHAADANPMAKHFAENYIGLSDQAESVLFRVNALINKEIKYKAEPDGQDEWIVAQTEGDCEDIALRKRQELLAVGFDNKDLLFVFLVDKNTKLGHVVLYVQSTKTVLDMDRNQLYSLDKFMTKFGYEFGCVIRDTRLDSPKFGSQRCQS